MPPDKKKRSARELELMEVASRARKTGTVSSPPNEVLAMLVRRGFRPESVPPDLPFPAKMDQTSIARFAELFGHYAFRLFLRGAVQRPEGFSPPQTSRYLTPEQSVLYADLLIEFGMAGKTRAGLYRLKHPGSGFGTILEWYVARELRHRFAFQTETGIRLHVPGAGGDLDVVAAAEGKLYYLELKSSPPRNLSENAAGAFWNRVILLRPDISMFVVDTALRLSDKILPMLENTFPVKQSGRLRPRRIGNQLWVIAPRIYAVNGQRDLMANIGRAIAEGLREISSGTGA